MSEEGRIGSERGGASSTPGHSRLNVKRSRTNGKACLRCHQRKVRCDVLQHGIPCSNCKSQNHESNCRLYERKRRRNSLVEGDKRHVLIQPRMDDFTRVSERREANKQGETSVETPASQRSREHRQRLASPSNETHSGDSEDEQASRNIAEFVDREEVRVKVIEMNSRLFFIGTEVSNLHHLVRQRSSNPSLHFGIRQLARKYTAHEYIHVPAEALELPEKPLADELLRAYFLHINRGWPIVNEEDFMNRYEAADPQDPVPLPLLHAMFLVGAHVTGSSREEIRALKSSCYRKVKKLVDCRFEQDRALYVQVALLMTWHSDGLEDVVANAWHWVGIAARAALGLGMHRNANMSTMLPFHKRQWVRLWWILYQFDVLVSAAYGRPQAINLDDCDVPDLEPSHFEGIPGANIDFVIEHTNLCVLFSKTMKRRLSLKCTPAERFESTKQADEALANFMINLPETLQLSLSDTDVWRSTLHLTYNNLLILLHRPPAQKGDNYTSEDANDLRTCGDATAVISSLLEGLYCCKSLSKLWLSGVYALFTAIVHANNEKCSNNPLVAAKSSKMFDSLLQSLRELGHHWLYAHSLVRLFEEQASRCKLRERRRAALQGSVNVDVAIDPTTSAHGAGFSLRPNAPGPSHTYSLPHTSNNTAPLGVQTSFPSTSAHRGPGLGQGPLHTGHNRPDLNVSNDPALNSDGQPSGMGLVNMPQDQQYFINGSLDTSQGSALLMDPFGMPDASTVDFLLAGMYTEYGL